MDFDFDFEKAKIKKGGNNDALADTFSQFVFAKAQSLNIEASNKFDFIAGKGSSKQLENCEETLPKEDQQKLYTFDDIFTRASTVTKTQKNIDPFGIL